MVPGHGGEIDGDITVFAAADDILPVGDGHLGAVGKVQPRPDLRLPPEGQQGDDAAQQQKHRQRRHHIPEQADVAVRHSRILLQKGIEHFHATTSFF